MADHEDDGLALAARIRARQVSAVDVLEAAIERSEEADRSLGILAATWFDEAIATAGAGVDDEAPFAGVPLLYKDLGAAEGGRPTSSGSRVLRDRDHRAAADAPLAARLRSAGFVSFGSTRTPELGAQPTTQPLAGGPCRNPWGLDLSCGGSSGGAAAAVAAGVVPVAHGTDGYGSLRDPASWCGVVGLKPSRGRTSTGSPNPVSTEHVLTRTMRDTAAVLDAVHGRQPGDLDVLPAPRRPYVEAASSDPSSLRIGLLAGPIGPYGPLHESAVAGACSVAHLLADLGHRVEVVEIPELVDEAAVAAMTLVRAGRLWAVNPLRTALGRPFTEDEVEPFTWAVTRPGREATADEVLRAQADLHRWAQRLVGAWARMDVLVSPTTPGPAPPLAEMVPDLGDMTGTMHRFHTVRCLTAPFNVTGQPALSLPLGRTDDGMPQGVQLVADIGREDVLLALGGQLERARPWTAHRPATWLGG